ncbi:Sporulation-specific protein 71 [Spathaspora sp. JA1]|nr:Sporulation-specific protein 71 [Spathaspora sp. JA1]
MSNDRSFSIPKASYTAPLISLLPSHVLSHTSKCLFIGGIPAVWHNDNSNNLMSDFLKTSMKRKFHKRNQIIEQYIRGTTSESDNTEYNNQLVIDQHEFLSRKQEVLNKITKHNNESKTTCESSLPNDSFVIDAASSKHTSVAPSVDISPPVLNRKPRFLALPGDSNLSLPHSIPSSIRTSKSSKMVLELPHPITQLNLETFNKENKRFSKKLRQFVYRSRGKSRIRDFRQKILSSLISTYHSGEIVRMDKMLVMIKEIVGNVSENFDGDELESRVYERWKEYIVVLRRTYSFTEPLMLQLYDISKAPTADSSNPPRVGFALNSEVSAKFYNTLDKSISLTVRQADETFTYILKCNNQTKALKWLYFIKSSLGHEMNTLFNIYVHHIGKFIQVKVPEHILEKSLASTESVHMKESEFGYKVQRAELVQYLKNIIQSKFKIDISNSWFCFRFYDHLEWVPNDSELLFISNTLYSPTFQLEYRAIKLTTVNTPTYKLDEPIPIEGFLARLTSTSGRTKGVIHDFYKISYFFTNKNLLFFTKYYRVIPPSLDDHLLTSTDKIPIVYEHNLYPIDEKGHIEWLRNDFTTGDGNCLSELERRTQQIVRAEGLIDMSRIADIRKIPPSNMSPTQKLLSSNLWYASSGLIDDEDILDSCFEIELVTGCIIKLQAHSKQVRDQWMFHLQLLNQFWTIHAQEEIERQIVVRTTNMKNLNASEYVDSNAPQQVNQLELRSTVADTVINNISSMISTTLVLKSGFLYHKRKKHATFNQFFAVLCPGFLILFHIFKRSKNTGSWKKTSYFEHYLTIPISECYIYAGFAAELDLLESKSETRGTHLERHSVPRLHSNGWKSQEEECSLCFTLWFGKKRNISNYERIISRQQTKPVALHLEKNPGLIKMVAKLGVTGQSVMFMTKSRQDRDQWVTRLLCEMDRF